MLTILNINKSGDQKLKVHGFVVLNNIKTNLIQI